MNANESKIIKDRSKRILTAYGYKLKMSIIIKAAKSNGFSTWMMKEFKPIKEKLDILIEALIFDHNITANQFSELNKHIKIKDNKIQLNTSEIFKV